MVKEAKLQQEAFYVSASDKLPKEITGGKKEDDSLRSHAVIYFLILNKELYLCLS